MKKLYQSGFTLVEFMVTVAIMGVVTLAIFEGMRMSSDSHRVIEKFVIRTQLAFDISALLSNEGSCEKTLAGKKLGDEIDFIKNQQGRSVFTKNGSISFSYKIGKIYTRDIAMIDSDGLRIIELIVELHKSNGEKFIEKLPLKIKSDPTTGIINECNINTELILKTTKQDICTSWFGVFNSTTSSCNIDNELLLKSGGSMSGDLNSSSSMQFSGATSTSANLTNIATDRLCAGGECMMSFSAKFCPAGEVLWKITGNSIECRKIYCSNTTYYDGIDSITGAVICKPLPSKICGSTKEYVDKILPDGTITCKQVPVNAVVSCGSGYYIESISGGAAICKPFPAPSCPSGYFIESFGLGSTTCKPGPDVTSKYCPSGSGLVGFDSSSQPVCKRYKIVSTCGDYKFSSSWGSGDCDNWWDRNWQCEQQFGAGFRVEQCSNKRNTKSYIFCCKDDVLWE